LDNKKKVIGKPPNIVPPGVTGFCPGCHYGIFTRVALEVIDELGIAGRTIHDSGGGCYGGAMLLYPTDNCHGAHGPDLALATAIKRLHPDLIVWCQLGDGAALSIGLSHFVHTFLREEQLTLILLNNLCYGQTGGQMAPTTPLGMVTTTTPGGRDRKLHGLNIHTAEFVAQFEGCVYSARGALDTPAHYEQAKKMITTAFQKQIAGVNGTSFVEILTACPTNWGMKPVDSLNFMKEKMIPEYPLGEFKNVDLI
jgi:2-oxoglutarate ferredoxin oxidoreductase subunit beta